MTSDFVVPGGESSVAKYQATAVSKDVTAQASGGPALQWILMKDVDIASGYETPPAPKQVPEYEGQVVVVPGVLGQSAS